MVNEQWFILHWSRLEILKPLIYGGIKICWLGLVTRLSIEVGYTKQLSRVTSWWSEAREGTLPIDGLAQRVDPVLPPGVKCLKRRSR